MRSRATVCVKHFPSLECKRVCLHLELFLPISSPRLQSDFSPDVILLLCPPPPASASSPTLSCVCGGHRPSIPRMGLDPQAHLEVIKDTGGGGRGEGWCRERKRRRQEGRGGDRGGEERGRRKEGQRRRRKPLLFQHIGALFPLWRV